MRVIVEIGDCRVL